MQSCFTNQFTVNITFVKLNTSSDLVFLDRHLSNCSEECMALIATIKILPLSGQRL